MTFFPDLTPYSYRPGEVALNVGWLGDGERYPEGSVAQDTLSRIAWLCLNEPVQQTRGLHTCELCPWEENVGSYLLVEGAKPHRLGSNEVRVPGEGVTYAAPSLVLHYLLHHGYAPPAAFLNAAERLPNRLPAWRVERLTWEQAKLLGEEGARA